MNYGNILPVTGGAGALVLGHFLGLDDIIAAAIVLVLAGIVSYRYGHRLGNRRTTKVLAVVAVAAAAAALVHIAGLSWTLSFAAGLFVVGFLMWLLAALSMRGARAHA